MLIAIDLTALADNFSGIERYACEMTKALLRLGTDDSFILLFKDSVFPGFTDWENDRRVQIQVLPSNGASKLVFSQLKLPLALRHTKADVYLFMAFAAPMLFLSEKVMNTVHDLCCWDHPETMTAKSRLLWRALIAKASRGKLIDTVSEFSKARIIDHYNVPEDRVVVGYCGVSRRFDRRTWEGSDGSDEIHEKYGLPSRYVLTLSTIEPRKNIPELIEAWRIYRRAARRPADLVLAGRKGWKTESLLEGLSDDELAHVHVTGFVEDSDLPVVYGLAETFVFPSIYEGFGLPPVEASLAGTRVICSDIPCLKEIMGNAATYYKLGDVGELAKKLEGPSSVLGELPRTYSWHTSAELLYKALELHYG